MKASIRRTKEAIDKQIFMARGAKPWSYGFGPYRREQLKRAIRDDGLIAAIASRESLPQSLGVGIDERIIEYPWLKSQLLNIGNELDILDAGSTLNFDWVLDQVREFSDSLTILTLAPEPRCFWKRKISYVFGDLRSTKFKDESFDVIACLSVLEHVGMNNEIYTGQTSQQKSSDFKTALLEMKRLLKPKGSLLISVPYGAYENHGFFQQFDAELVSHTIDTFCPSQFYEEYFLYKSTGWQRSDKTECSDAKYFNPRNSSAEAPDKAASARSVCCLRLVK